MRGASALARFLHDDADPSLRVTVIWEPVLPGDRGPPEAALAGALSDPRVRRYWDPVRLVSSALAASLLAHPERAAGFDLAGGGRIVWDTILVFADGARWDAEPPAPAFAGNPVVDAIGDAARALR